MQENGLVEVSFAEPLRRMIKALGLWQEDIPYEEFKKTYFDDWGMTGREMLQVLGTDVMRNNFHQDVWLLLAKQELLKHEMVCISDVRFENEAQLIKDLGGFVIRINRPGALTADLHESEVALDNYEEFDWIIDNDGDLLKFKKEVAKATLGCLCRSLHG